MRSLASIKKNTLSIGMIPVVLFLLTCRGFETMTNAQPPAISISWHDKTDLLFSYNILNAKSNSVVLILHVAGRDDESREIEIEGGIYKLVALACKAGEECNEYQKRTGSESLTNQMWRQFAVEIANGKDCKKFSISASHGDFMRFSKQTKALASILRFVSQGQPKAFRLFNDLDLMSDAMVPPM